jgi:hypothetical protein
MLTCPQGWKQKKEQVLDEANMLLGGAFVYRVRQLIDMFCLEEKQLSRDWELEKVQGSRGVRKISSP